VLLRSDFSNCSRCVFLGRPSITCTRTDASREVACSGNATRRDTSSGNDGRPSESPAAAQPAAAQPAAAAEPAAAGTSAAATAFKL